MEVTNLKDFDTHAVMGGSDIVSFGISNSAEFITVLSKTLYSDEMLAVVRETICNAWDAHIVTNRQDVPVEVTISKEHILIRDFGPGIPHNMIQQVYCVYGASTKTRDGNQTGGFGLGCKAPFAYSDHFTVTSMHNGVKTVYAASRGSSETQGLPDMRIMAQMPTEETGLEVCIPIQHERDTPNFRDKACKVIMEGGINAKLNGSLISPLNIDMSEGFCFFTEDHGANHYPNRIYVRYGSVLYPVDLNKVDNIYSDFSRFIRQADLFRIKGLYLVAPPSSLSITPSRESLNYTKNTQETLAKLFSDAVSKITEAIKRSHAIVRKEYLENLSKTDSHVPFIKTTLHQMHVSSRNRKAKIQEILSKESQILEIVRSDYPTTTEAMRLKFYDSLNRTKKVSGYKLAPSTYDSGSLPTFNLRRFWKSENKALIKAGFKDLKKFGLFDHSYYYSRNYIIPTQDSRVSPYNAWSVIERVVFISSSKIGIRDNVVSAGREVVPELKNTNFTGLLFLTTKKNHKDIVDHFTKRNFRVVDIDAFRKKTAEYMKMKEPELIGPVKPVEKPKALRMVKKNELLLASSFLPDVQSKKRFKSVSEMMHKYRNDPETTIKVSSDYEAVCQIGKTGVAQYLLHSNSHYGSMDKNLITLYGDKIGVGTHAEVRVQLKAGKKYINTYIAEQLHKEFRQYISDFLQRLYIKSVTGYDFTNAIGKIRRISPNYSISGIKDKFDDPRKEMLFHLFEHVATSYSVPFFASEVVHRTKFGPESLSNYYKKLWREYSQGRKTAYRRSVLINKTKFLNLVDVSKLPVPLKANKMKRFEEFLESAKRLSEVL